MRDVEQETADLDAITQALMTKARSERGHSGFVSKLILPHTIGITCSACRVTGRASLGSEGQEAFYEGDLVTVDCSEPVTHEAPDVP